MLAGVGLRLAAGGRVVSVIARREDRLRQLRQSAANLPGTIHPVIADYSDSASFREAIRQAQHENGPVDCAICWIHSTAPAAIGIVASEVRGKVVHIRSSSSKDPMRLIREDPPPSDLAARYQVVLLGFQPGPEGSRWLTDEEIVDGVLGALESDERVVVVGSVAPWELRPR